MAYVAFDRVMETSTTTGTGNIALAAAVTGFRRFSSVCAVNDTLHYMIEAVDADGLPTGDWETGYGAYSAADTLTRTAVEASTNAGAAVNFPAGTKRVALVQTAKTVQGGSAFPSSPASNQRFYRTDRNIEYFYDGTRWLSVQLHSLSLGNWSAGASTSTYAPIPYLGTHSLWLDSWDNSRFRNAAGEWDLILYSRVAGGTLTTLDTVDGSADATNTWIGGHRSLAAALDTSAQIFVLSISEISGTATFTGSASLNFRLIG